jgi:hypothetical protein
VIHQQSGRLIGNAKRLTGNITEDGLCTALRFPIDKPGRQSRSAFRSLLLSDRLTTHGESLNKTADQLPLLDLVVTLNDLGSGQGESGDEGDGEDGFDGDHFEFVEYMCGYVRVGLIVGFRTG